VVKGARLPYRGSWIGKGLRVFFDDLTEVVLRETEETKEQFEVDTITFGDDPQACLPSVQPVLTLDDRDQARPRVTKLVA
jgi:hypothetical protein